MNIQIIKFRLRRFVKLGKGLPLPYLAVVILIMIAVGMYIWRLSESMPEVYYIVAAGWILTFFVHLKRKDSRFISLIEEHPSRLFALEYLLFSFPLWGILLFCPFPYMAGLYVGGIGAIAWLPRPIRRMKYGIPLYRLIPVDCFEWRSGMRQSGGWFTLLYLLAIAGLFLPYASLLPVWLMTIL